MCPHALRGRKYQFGDAPGTWSTSPGLWALLAVYSTSNWTTSRFSKFLLLTSLPLLFLPLPWPFMLMCFYKTNKNLSRKHEITMKPNQTCSKASEGPVQSELCETIFWELKPNSLLCLRHSTKAHGTDVPLAGKQKALWNYFCKKVFSLIFSKIPRAPLSLCPT